MKMNGTRNHRHTPVVLVGDNAPPRGVKLMRRTIQLSEASWERIRQLGLANKGKKKKTPSKTRPSQKIVCVGFSRNGDPCKMFSKSGSTLCGAHDPVSHQLMLGPRPRMPK